VKRPALAVLAAALTRRAGATSPIPYSGAPGGSGGAIVLQMQGGDDLEANLRAYGATGTVYGIVSLLAESTAKAQWKLYRKLDPAAVAAPQRSRFTTGDRGTDQRTEVLDHQALAVLNHPNDHLTRFELFEVGQQHQELTGELWWVLDRDNPLRVPMAIWPVRPDRINPVPHPTAFISGYEYRGPNGETVPLRTDEVICERRMNPMDFMRGMGPVQSLITSIDGMKYAAQYNRNFFINGADAGGVVIAPEFMTDEQFDTWTTRWRQSHQGVARAHRVAFLEGGMTWASNAVSQRDMEFVNLTNVSRDLIREAWRMHKVMLGSSDDVNRANAQTGEEVFVAWQSLPRLDRRRMTLNERYLPAFYPPKVIPDVEFDYVNPSPHDREADNQELTTKSVAYQALVSAGADPDDAAEVCGLPPMRTVTPVPALPPGIGPQPPPAPPVAAGLGLPFLAAAPSLAPVAEQLQVAATRAAADYQSQIIPTQRQELLDQITREIDAGRASELGNLTVASAAGAALLAAAMTSYAVTAAGQATTEARAQGASVAPVHPPAAVVQQIAAVVAALMAAELAVTAGRAAGLAFAPGLTGVQVAAKVAPQLEALPETGTASHVSGALHAAGNRARVATFLAGPPGQLVASEELDSNTCEPCRAVNGRVIGSTSDADIEARVHDLYPVGGYFGCAGRDRCRGTVTTTYSPAAGASVPAKAAGAFEGDIMSMIRGWPETGPATVPVAHANGINKGGG
jgi:HK97 family phage portal protein